MGAILTTSVAAARGGGGACADAADVEVAVAYSTDRAVFGAHLCISVPAAGGLQQLPGPARAMPPQAVTSQPQQRRRRMLQQQPGGQRALPQAVQIDVGRDAKVSFERDADGELHALVVVGEGYCYNSITRNRRAAPKVCDQRPKAEAAVLAYAAASARAFRAHVVVEGLAAAGAGSAGVAVREAVEGAVALPPHRGETPAAVQRLINPCTKVSGC